MASNVYLREKLTSLCGDLGFTSHTPPPPLCTDNGIMIAWTALEHLKSSMTSQDQSLRQQTTPTKEAERKLKCKPLQLLYYDSEMDGLDFRPKWPLGEDISNSVKQSTIKLPKLNYFR